MRRDSLANIRKVLRLVRIVYGLCLAIALCGGPVSAQILPIRALHDSGQSITASYEGWFPNEDGSYSILFGYYNRNEKQVLDIPIGPDNRIEPGGPDQGQPTHFLIRRQWGVFVVKVPKDFGDKELTWTITAHGTTTSVPAGLDPLWEISPFLDDNGNTPPRLILEDGGPTVQGPIPVGATKTAKVGQPLALGIRIADDAKLIPGMRRRETPPVKVTWSKYRGPGDVVFENVHPMVEEQDPPAEGTAFSGRAATTATFSEPGEYVLEVVLNDWTGLGGRGFLCCWTNGLVTVSVAAR